MAGFSLVLLFFLAPVLVIAMPFLFAGEWLKEMLPQEILDMFSDFNLAEMDWAAMFEAFRGFFDGLFAGAVSIGTGG